MNARDKRQALQALLVPVAPKDWAVYAEPPTSIQVPCLVITPRVPYRVRVNAAVEDVNLSVVAFVPAAAEAPLSLFDAVFDAVAPVVTGIEGASYDGVVSVSQVADRNGAEYLAASIDLTLS